MADIRLQDYVARIKEMVRGDQHDEAIAHCQHILKYHSKHIETYCLLGEACLEKEMVRESIEFFQRTLSADPESFIARVGMGIIYDGQGLSEEAIWQMERAFELVPGNAEVRQELQRLYAQRDGKEKSRLKLTRGALGRLYCRNGLYERAITEFRSVLRQEPDLPDIRVALVEALWREGRRLEAVEACLELLDALPNCLKANLILAEIWMRGGHEDASGEKLDLARALDPENLVAQDMMGRDSPLPPNEVLIPELAFTPGVSMVVAADATAEGAAWGTEGSEIELFSDDSLLDAGEEWGAEDGLPDWLLDIGVTDIAEAQVVEDGAIPDEEDALAEDLPDWLTELTGEGAVPIVEEGEAFAVSEPAVAGDEISDRATEAIEPEIGAIPADEPAAESVPDWLREVQEPEEEKSGPSAAGVLAAAGLAAAGAVLAAEVLDGDDAPESEADEIPVQPAALDAPDVDEPELPAEEVPVADVPDWLRDMQSAEAEGSQLEALDEEELLPTEGIAPLAEAIPEAADAGPDEDAPDWLQELATPEVEDAAAEETDGGLPVAGIAVAGAVAAAEIPDWLQDLQEADVEEEAAPLAEAMPEAADAGPDEDVPDWLQELAEPEVEDVVPEETDDGLPVAGIAVAGAVAAAEIPDWLQELATPEAQDAALDVAAEETPVVEVASEGEAVEAVRAAEVPVWLHELMDEESPPVKDAEQPGPAVDLETEPPPEAEVAPADDVPDWLRELQEPEEEAEAPSIVDALPAAGLAVAGGVAAAEVYERLHEPEEPVIEEPLPEPEPMTPPDGAAEPVPASLQALVDAGILDESDLDTAMAEMSAEDLEAQRAEEVPAWLHDLMDEETPSEEVSVPPSAEIPAAAVPDWLEELAPEDEQVSLPDMEGAPDVEALEEETPTAEIPAWLQELEEPEAEKVALPEGDVVPEVDLPVEEAIPEDVPAWLRELEEPEDEKVGPPDAGVLLGADLLVEEAVPEDVPAWLRELEEPEDEKVELPVGDVAPEADLPVDEAAPEEVPAWLRELEEPEVEEVALPEADLSVEEVAAEDVPAWLREFEEPETEETVLPEADVVPEALADDEVSPEPLPAWLQEFEERETEVTHPDEGMPEEVSSAGVAEQALPAWLQEAEDRDGGKVIPTVTAAALSVGLQDDKAPPEAPEPVVPVDEPLASAEVAPPMAEVVPSTTEIPASLQALVDAGILDEADLEAAMSEMSEEDLEGQRAEAVPEWLNDLMSEEDASLPAGEIPVEAAPVVEESVPPLVVETPEEAVPVVEEIEPPPVVEMPEEAVPVVEEIEPPPIVEVPEEAVPVVEEIEPPLVVEVPEKAVPVVEEIESPPVLETPKMEPVVESVIPVLERDVQPVVEEKSPELTADDSIDVLPVDEPAPAPHDLEIAPPTELEMVAPFERVEVEEEVASPSAIDELSALLESRPRDHKARLELARAYQGEQDWNAALGHYEKLVSARKLLPSVVDDLEAMADKDVNRSRLFQILGDAYMNEDRLEDALAMYRQARDALTKR